MCFYGQTLNSAGYHLFQLINAGKGEALRIRAILRSLVPTFDLVGIISIPSKMPVVNKGTSGLGTKGFFVFWSSMCSLSQLILSTFLPFSLLIHQMALSLSLTCQPVSAPTTRLPWCFSWNECMALWTRTFWCTCWKLVSYLTCGQPHHWTR